ncbi:MAG: hypothetical protein ACE14V_12015 [bacterium]
MSRKVTVVFGAIAIMLLISLVFGYANRIEIVSKLKKNNNDGTVYVYKITGGESAIVEIKNLDVSVNQKTMNVSFDYQLWNDKHPGEIDQILIAVENKVVKAIYNGIPGKSPGYSDSTNISFEVNLPGIGSEFGVYIVRIPARNIEEAKWHYEVEKGAHGDWRLQIAKIKAVE